MSMKETCITKIEDENFCIVYSCEPKYMKQLKELKKKYPNEVLVVYDYGQDGLEVQVPLKWFKFIKPPIKRTLTEDQRRAAAERLNNIRKNNND